jgi:hypothetical protein
VTSIQVPHQHRGNAASYRFGYTDAVGRQPHEKRSYFKTEQAWSAYQAGYIAGTSARSARQGAGTISGPLFEKEGTP